MRRFSTGSVRSTIGDPDLRSPSGFDSGLSPSAQDDTRGGNVRPKFRFTPDFRRYFFSFKLIKKPSPVGEGGPRQWWMRSPRKKLTYTRHLIRQPSAATFSHWRRLSFVCALLANKYKPVFSNIYLPKKVLCVTPRNPTFPPLRVILSGGRSPESNPQGDRRSGSPNAEHTPPWCPTSAPLCHPERRATARNRTRRATAGRDLRTSSAQPPAPHFRPYVSS